MLSFTVLEQKFGTPAALHCLQENIEKAARIRSAEVAALDPDQRLLNTRSTRRRITCARRRNIGRRRPPVSLHRPGFRRGAVAGRDPPGRRACRTGARHRRVDRGLLPRGGRHRRCRSHGRRHCRHQPAARRLSAAGRDRARLHAGRGQPGPGSMPRRWPPSNWKPDRRNRRGQTPQDKFFDTSPWSALRRSDKAAIEGYVDAPGNGSGSRRSRHPLISTAAPRRISSCAP